MKEQTKTKNTKSVISPEVRAILNEHKEEMERYLGTLLKASSEDFQRYTGALAEDFQGKVTVVAEQFSGLTGKVDKVIRVQETHTEMIGVVMEDISEIKTDIKNKADKIEVTRLDRRVLALERAV